MKVSKATTVPVRPLYSIASLALAAFLGGVLGGAYVLYYNFNALEQPRHAKAALIGGVVFTIVLLVGLSFVPASTVESIPMFLIPVLTMCVMVGIAHYFQGAALEAQQESQSPAAPIWKAALVGLGGLVLTLILLFAISFLIPQPKTDAPTVSYEEQLERFYTNEENGNQFYDLFDKEVSDSLLLVELEQRSIPAWKENVALATSFSELPLDSLDDPEGDLATLLEYAQLQLAVFETSRTILLEEVDSSANDARLDSLTKRLEVVQDRMNR